MRPILAVRTAPFFLLVSLGVVAGGCDDDDGMVPLDAGADSGQLDAAALDSGMADGGDDLQAVRIDFEARVGSLAFACDETYTVGSADTEVKPLDFKLYVHDLALLTDDGAQSVALEQDGAFQSGAVAMLDFEDDTGSCSNGTSAMNTAIVGSVPRGTYQGLSFVIGVPESLNHGNQATAPSPLNIEGMFWNWTNGYKFLRIDVAPMHGGDDDADAGMADDDNDEDAGAGAGHAGAKGFLVHLGSTLCAGNPAADEPVICQRANRPAVRLEDFDPSKQKIVLDLATLLASSDVSVDHGGAQGCMSGGMDPECGPVFGQLGLDLATGQATGNPAFLSIEDK